MPSLRRVASSPAIRVAPYAVQQSTSSSTGSLGRRGQQPLARLPSVTGPRAVLGEMSWWQVHSGQQPEGQDAPEDLFEPEPEPEPVEDDALIAEAVRIAISHRDQDRDQPSALGFNDEQDSGTDQDEDSEADSSPANQVPPTSLLPLADDDDTEDAHEDTLTPESYSDDSDASSSPPSSPPALVETPSPASSQTSSPASSYPSSPVALRPGSRYKRPSPYPPPFRLSSASSSNSRQGRKPMSLSRTFSLDDLEHDDSFTKDMSLDEIIADLSSPASLAAAHARFMSLSSSRPPSGSFELLPADA